MDHTREIQQDPKANGGAQLPRIIWVAARPPVPPFTGETSKALSGITALASATTVDVVAFSEAEEITTNAKAFSEYWHRQSVHAHWLPLGPRPGRLRAILSRRFMSGLRLEKSDLPAKLDELRWKDPGRLTLFDDILLAPLLKRYGANAIVSPHDCISVMFWSHFHNAPFAGSAGRQFFRSLLARYYERAFYHRALLTHVVTHRDRLLLAAVNPKARFAVAAMADLMNPGFSDSDPEVWDVLVWGDLAIGSILHGARDFLAAARRQSLLSAFRVLVVGKVTPGEAHRVLGGTLFSQVAYFPRLEDERGRLRHARITVIPDIGGAGVKNRCMNVLAAGKCLACRYEQMEGLENACDIGAINDVAFPGLVAKVKTVLSAGSWQLVAVKGREIFHRHYGEAGSRSQWIAMVERALFVRAQIANGTTAALKRGSSNPDRR